MIYIKHDRESNTIKKRNFICFAVMGLAAALSLTLSAQVKVVNHPIPVNGDFSQGVWQDVPEQSGFVPLKSSGKTKPGAQTAFKVAADADNLYLNICCMFYGEAGVITPIPIRRSGNRKCFTAKITGRSGEFRLLHVTGK